MEPHTSCHSADLKSHPYSVQPSVISVSDLLLCIHIKVFICCFCAILLFFPCIPSSFIVFVMSCVTVCVCLCGVHCRLVLLYTTQSFTKLIINKCEIANVLKINHIF